jgi:hypothetical protein
MAVRRGGVRTSTCDASLYTSIKWPQNAGLARNSVRLSCCRCRQYMLYRTLERQVRRHFPTK